MVSPQIKVVKHIHISSYVKGQMYLDLSIKNYLVLCSSQVLEVFGATKLNQTDGSHYSCLMPFFLIFGVLVIKLFWTFKLVLLCVSSYIHVSIPFYFGTQSNKN